MSYAGWTLDNDRYETAPGETHYDADEGIALCKLCHERYDEADLTLGVCDDCIHERMDNKTLEAFLSDAPEAELDFYIDFLRDKCPHYLLNICRNAFWSEPCLMGRKKYIKEYVEDIKSDIAGWLLGRETINYMEGKIINGNYTR